jgi:chemosensory pili system protein ChpA (sensor histidine kinase/response regulator)
MSPSTILVVDDDPDVLASVAEVLTDAGFEVVTFRNCSLALTHLCQNPAPAAVVVDLLMPGMNAWELFGQMRRRENLAHVPMIAMTGAGPQLGAPVPQHMVLRKPIDSTRLLALLRASTATAAAG